MIDILTTGNPQGYFWMAGQAATERAMIHALISSGQARVHYIAMGDTESRERLSRHNAEYIKAGTFAVHDVHDRPTVDALLDRAAGVMQHSLPDFEILEWYLDHRVARRVPIVLHMHSLLLNRIERLSFGTFWSQWDGSTSSKLVTQTRSASARATALCRSLVPPTSAGFPPCVEIPPGVQSLEGGDRAAGRRHMGVAADVPVLLSLGRITGEKAAYHQLIRAFAEVVRAADGFADAQLVLVGTVAAHDHEYFKTLVALSTELGVEKQVKVHLHVPNELKQDFLAAADVLVSLACNPQEAFGLALVEGMSAGLPIIATNWNGYPEVLGEAYRPWLVSTVADHQVAGAEREYAQDQQERMVEARTRAVGDLLPGFQYPVTPVHGDVVRLMRRMLGDAGLRRELGEAGRRRAKDFTWARAMDRLLAVWQELAASPRPPAVATCQAPSPLVAMASHDLTSELRLVLRRQPAPGEPVPPQTQAIVEQLLQAGSEGLTWRELDKLHGDDAIARYRLLGLIHLGIVAPAS